MERRGNTSRVLFRCYNNHEIVWFSSPILQSKYVANLRVIHGFMSSGLTETQYRGFMEAASLGSIEHTFLDTATGEIQSEQAYIDNDGDIIVTDARHDSSRNAQHTTVAALSY
ncbi:hypothetical protein QZH41_002710 [Actinostola sp. cb2023]|nr:hypothetical protein QZH41_002710 [Actinostola sp. cb2023]